MNDTAVSGHRKCRANQENHIISMPYGADGAAASTLAPSVSPVVDSICRVGRTVSSIGTRSSPITKSESSRQSEKAPAKGLKPRSFGAIAFASTCAVGWTAGVVLSALLVPFLALALVILLPVLYNVALAGWKMWNVNSFLVYPD